MSRTFKDKKIKYMSDVEIAQRFNRQTRNAETLQHRLNIAMLELEETNAEMKYTINQLTNGAK
jgi:hypothetical protein